jgi:hypothetical protein
MVLRRQLRAEAIETPRALFSVLVGVVSRGVAVTAGGFDCPARQPQWLVAWLDPLLYVRLSCASKIGILVVNNKRELAKSASFKALRPRQ